MKRNSEERAVLARKMERDEMKTYRTRGVLAMAGWALVALCGLTRVAQAQEFFWLEEPASPIYEGSNAVFRIGRTGATNHVTIVLQSSNPAALLIVNTNIFFPPGETERTFNVEPLDGTNTVSITGTAPGYSQVGPIDFPVRNVSPRIETEAADPFLDREEYPVAEPLTFTVQASDVLADLNPADPLIDGLYARWDFGDGNVSNVVCDISGMSVIQYTYLTPGEKNVRVTITDKDGGSAQALLRRLQILPGISLMSQIIGRSGISYKGFTTGIGEGEVDILYPPDYSVTLTTPYSTTYLFGADQQDVVVEAVPVPVEIISATSPITTETNIFQSFFHVWRGSGFELQSATNYPLAAAREQLLRMDGTSRSIEAVFSREYRVGDGWGDMDQDGLPDPWEEMHWPGLGEFERVNRAENPDEDFLPRGVNATTMAYPLPLADRNYTADGPNFSNFHEVRGQHAGLNSTRSTNDPPVNADGEQLAEYDEPRFDLGGDVDTRDFFGTDPTNPDTDGDGMSDGWEYYFWLQGMRWQWQIDVDGGNPALIGGRRYDPTRIIESDLVIEPQDIIEHFHPLYDGGRQDTDGDGLSNYEEYLLGTDPIHWDTDGDRMADGWEVMRGLNPLVQDAGGNPDGDYMAALDYTPGVPRGGEPVAPLLGQVHYNVYDAQGFDPRTGWGASYTERSRQFGAPQPNTSPYLNIDEYALMRFFIDEGRVGEVEPDDWGDFSTNPFNNDTDGDGAPDGWELYVSFDPNLNQSEAPWDVDRDSLLLPFEFGGQESSPNSGGSVTISVDTNTLETVYSAPEPMGNPNGRWWNKFWPTDPLNPDTDGDMLSDFAEGYSDIAPIYDPPGAWSSAYIRGSRAGGGFNPCCVDTDMDFIPDFAEAQYRFGRATYIFPDGSVVSVGGMDGSIFDSKSTLTDLTGEFENYDYDGDGLENYQEYWANAVWHFNYDKWTAGRGPGGYDPADLFMGTPHHWDWATAANYWQRPIREGYAPPLHIQYRFILPEPRPAILLMACMDPSLWDTDEDGMDDHYEMFYALNPLWSERADVIRKGPPFRIADIRVQPWTAGEAMADPDQDGIPNWEEAVFPERPDPANLNTDPSPYWVTDLSYEESWVNLYYGPGSNPWYWPPRSPGTPVFPYPAVQRLHIYPPTYVYSFANDEGYDTDNDNIPDKLEVTGSAGLGATDPGDFETPLRRKALYLDGQSAARSRYGHAFELNMLRSWTVEIWVRAEAPVSPTGSRQVIVERPIRYWETDPMPAPEHVRRNFRIGIEPDGVPFAEYNNTGNDIMAETVRGTSRKLEAGRWYHIAAVLDGPSEQFSMYIDGELAARRGTRLIPATGVIDGNPPIPIRLSAPIVVGAADSNPDGTLGGLGVPAPSLHSHFKGWVDELRVWSGARTHDQVREDVNRRYSVDDVQATMVDFATAQALLPDLSPPDMPYWQVRGELPPVVLYHYSFDNLPDPTYETIVPSGFALLNAQPDDGTYPGIPWWRQAPDRSRQYSNHKYVPYVENTPSHVPVEPLVNRFGNVVAYRYGVVHSSPFWTENAQPGEFGTAHYRNRMYTSQTGYFTSDTSLTEGWRDAAGLVPLWNARADLDVPLWDTGRPAIEAYDSNGDGISDYWYTRHGYDPAGPSVGLEDPDSDGLNNYWEFLLGSDPHNTHSLDPARVLSDGQWDSDGDGLSNWDEIYVHKTNPLRVDTDDDGLRDKEEIDGGFNARDALMPFVMRYVRNETGRGRIEVDGDVAAKDPLGSRFDLDEWTIDVSVRLLQWPSVTGTNVVLVSRHSAPYGRTTFQVGVNTNNQPYMMFETHGGSEYVLTANSVLPTNQWVRIAARLAEGATAGERAMDLFVGSDHLTRQVTGAYPATGEQFGPLVMAEGLVGDIDEVRIWNVPRTDDQIERLRHQKLHYGGDAAVLGILEPNAGQLQRTLDDDVNLDFWTVEGWFRTTGSGLVIGRSGGEADNGDILFNYLLGVNAIGVVEGQMSFRALVAVDYNEHDVPIFEQRWATVNISSPTRFVADGEWHFASLSFSGSELVLRVDGRVENRMEIDTVRKLPALDMTPAELALRNWTIEWHLLAGDEEPLLYADNVAATFATAEGDFLAGNGLAALDELRVFNIGSTDEEVEARRHSKTLPYTPSLVSYFDFDDLPGEGDPLPDRMEAIDKVRPEIVGNLDGDAVQTAGSELNAPVRVTPAMVLGYKLAAYFPMDDGTYLGSDRGFAGRQVKDFMRRLDFDFAGTFTDPTVYFMHNDPKYVTHYLDNVWDWAEDTSFSLDSNRDGVPDWWYMWFRMDPTGERIAFEDPDGDGLISLYEYMVFRDYGVALDPLNFNTFGYDPVNRPWRDRPDEAGDYFHRPATNTLMVGELYDDMDQLPDWWEELHGNMARFYYDADGDPDDDGWRNIEEYMYLETTNAPDGSRVILRHGTDPTDTADAPQPTLRGRVRYHGQAEGDVHVLAYRNKTMDGPPVGVADVTEVASGLWSFEIRNLRAGDLYLFAWRGDDPFAPGMPSGMPPGMPHQAITMRWGDMEGVEIGLTDRIHEAWFPAFSWTGLDPTPGVSDRYYVEIYNGANNKILATSVRANRTVFRKSDYMNATGWTSPALIFTQGLPPDNYRATVAHASVGTPFSRDSIHFSVHNDTLPAVTQVSPVSGGIVRHALHPLRWRVADGGVAQQFEVRVGPVGGGWVWSQAVSAPWRNEDGEYSFEFPEMFGQGSWTNGLYRWQVRAQRRTITGGVESFSDWSSTPEAEFQVNLADPAPDGNGAPALMGRVHYYGPSTNANLIVRAYSTPSFNGTPQGQAVVVWNRQTWGGEFKILGLRSGRYYLRAFVDALDNGEEDVWEPYGIGRSVEFGGSRHPFRTDYQVARYDLVEGRQVVRDIRLVVLDRDTDNDGLPDSLQDLDGDGMLITSTEEDLDDYAERSTVVALDNAGGDIGSYDVSGDGLTYDEAVAAGLDDPYAYHTDAYGIPLGAKRTLGLRLDPNVTDSDGDQVSDLEEIAAGSRPDDASDTARVKIESIRIDASGRAVVMWNTYANVANLSIEFTLESSPSLVDPQWSRAGTASVVVSGSKSGKAAIVDDNVVGGGRYYRLRVSVPERR